MRTVYGTTSDLKKPISINIKDTILLEMDVEETRMDIIGLPDE